MSTSLATRLARIERAVQGTKKAQTADVLVRRLLGSCFPAQRKFVLDRSPFALAFCTRRASKSWACCVKLLIAGLRLPNSSGLYLAITRDEAKKMVWEPILKVIDRELGLGCTFNESSLTVTLPNNSRIYLIGVDQEGEARKLLGQALPQVCIDESQDIRSDIRKLIMETLKPAVAQHRGQITLSGTPSAAVTGYFHDLTTGSHADSPLWSAHKWSWRENPHVKDAIEATIAEMTATLGPAYLESPEYRRQFLGEWVLLSDELCYHFAPAKNTAPDPLPEGVWTFLLAVDLGLADASACTVAGYREHDTKLYCVYSEKRSGLDFTGLSTWVHGLRKQFSIKREWIDGSNAQGVEELNNRLGHRFAPADKLDKATHMAMLDNDLALGQILVDPVRASDLVDEWGSLIWDAKAKARGKMVEDPRCPNHCADSKLYVWRMSRSYRAKPEQVKPRPGTVEFIEAQARERDLAAIARIKARQNQQQMMGAALPRRW